MKNVVVVVLLVMVIAGLIVYDYYRILNRIIYLDDNTMIVVENGVRRLVHKGYVIVSKYPPEDPWDSDVLQAVINRGSSASTVFNFNVVSTNASVLNNYVVVERDNTTNVYRYFLYTVVFRANQPTASLTIRYTAGSSHNNIITTGTLTNLTVNQIYTWYVNVSWYVYNSDVFDLYLFPFNSDGGSIRTAIVSDVSCNGTSVSTSTSNVRYNNTHIMITLNFAYPSALRDKAPVVCSWNGSYTTVMYMLVKQPLNIDQVAFNVFYIAPTSPSFTP